MTDTTAAIEQPRDMQTRFDDCLRDSRKTQKTIDNAMDKADKGWRARLFELAQKCESAAEFIGYCNQAAANVRGDKPKVWTQAQSDIKKAWQDHGLIPSEFDTLESLRRAKIDANKAAQAAEQDAIASENKRQHNIPAKLAAEFESIGALSAACHESDMDAYAAVLESTIAELLAIRDGGKGKLKAASLRIGA